MAGPHTVTAMNLHGHIDHALRSLGCIQFCHCRLARHPPGTRIFYPGGAINEKGRGITLHDTGRVTFKPGQDFQEIDIMSGVHDAYSGDETFFDTFICDSLT